MSERENLSIQTAAAETNSQITRTVLRLREMILSGDFSAGERVSEAPLTARLGASRTPIRLALERLAHEGLLDPYPTGGFIVRRFTLEDIWDGIEVRGLLEGAAARLAAERLTDEAQLTGLRTCQDAMDALGEPTPDTLPQYLALNDRFHDEILRLAKSLTLKRSLEQLLSLPLASRQALVSLRIRFPEASDIFIVGRDQHLRIIEAIAKRQGARAENIAREHAEITRRALQFALAHAHELSALPGGKLIQVS
ncbi:MAG TPA: GntR family transcriptional regulator [Vicinamibacterales bacterium]|nr:GntR family transcriptional regulator [Vicinamibacterales bacterium]